MSDMDFRRFSTFIGGNIYKRTFLVLSFFLAACVLSLFSPSTSEAGILSYKEWKSKRVLEAQALLSQSEARNKSYRKSHPVITAANEIKLQRLSRVSVHNIVMAKELVPNDYFVMYLVPRSRSYPGALNEAIRRLSKEELADILGNYRSRVIQADPQLSNSQKLSVGLKAMNIPNSNNKVATLTN
jgi:hypothetical protein